MVGGFTLNKMKDKERLKKLREWVDKRFKEANKLRDIGMLDDVEDRAMFYTETLDGIEIILRKK